MKKLFIPLFVSIIFISCQSKKEETQTASEIKVENIQFKKSSKPIIRPEGDTLISYVEISYPKLSGGNETINAKINQFFKNYALESLNSQLNMEDDSTQQVYVELDKAAEQFIYLPEAERKEFPDSPIMAFSYESTADTVLISPKIISFFVSDYIFQGGAHGNYATELFNFDAQTGELLELADFVSDTLALTKLAEVKFIAGEKIAAKEQGYEFNMEDYFFEDKKFTLPSNIGFTKTGLNFIFNPYEAASYARGQISFELSYKELTGILKEKYKP